MQLQHRLRHSCRPAAAAQQLWLPLALLLLLSAPVPLAAAAAVSEVEVMGKLRQALLDSDAAWTAGWAGWGANDTAAPPCTWAHVTCDSSQRVRSLFLRNSHLPVFGAGAAGPGPGPLLPELAQLEGLKELVLMRYAHIPGSMPVDWGLPGAFPSLRRLSVTALSLEGSLPEIQPGACPQLETIFLQLIQMESALPGSWGSSPAVLPVLQELSLRMRVTGKLPELWAGGFQRLQELIIFTRPGGEREAASRQLPPRWAAGFPQLRLLELGNLGLQGQLPPDWAQAGGFPALQQLRLGANELTGMLPQQLLQAHPSMTLVSLKGNRFTGPLPPEWGASKVESLLLGDNQLTGPAFPPAWLTAHSLPNMAVLDLSGNTGLSGSLPPGLPWPRLETLKLGRTGATGQVPEGWCSLPLARSLGHLWIGQTAVDPSLPACAAASMPQLRTDVRGTSGVVPATGGGVLPSPPPPQQQQEQQQEQQQPDEVAGGGKKSAAIPILVSLLLLAAAGAAAAAGWACWRRRQQRQRWEAGARQQQEGGRQQQQQDSRGSSRLLWAGAPRSDSGTRVQRRPSSPMVELAV